LVARGGDGGGDANLALIVAVAVVVPVAVVLVLAVIVGAVIIGVWRRRAFASSMEAVNISADEPQDDDVL
jgi:uncharacterized membrane protein (DUF106 family)